MGGIHVDCTKNVYRIWLGKTECNFQMCTHDTVNIQVVGEASEVVLTEGFEASQMTELVDDVINSLELIVV